MSQHIGHYSWSQARNSQEFIDSTTGVVLAPEVQPEPHQVLALSMGLMFFALFVIQAEAIGPYSTARDAGTMGIKQLAQGHNSKAHARIQIPNPRIGSQDLNHCTKLLPHTIPPPHTHTPYVEGNYTTLNCARLQY